MKKKIVIIGASHLSGAAIYKATQKWADLVLADIDPATVLKMIENEEKNIKRRVKKGAKRHTIVGLQFDSAEHINESIDTLLLHSRKATAVINCLSVNNKFLNEQTLSDAQNNGQLMKEIKQAVFINSLFPHLLAHELGNILIHISTDCVFDGSDGPYDEHAEATAQDVYGKSRFEGEPRESALVVRASVIGHDLTDKTSLVEWLKSKAGSTVSGFSKHLWNGLTAESFGRAIKLLIQKRNRFPAIGVLHIHSDDVSKHRLLRALNDNLDLGCTVLRDDRPGPDRRLRSLHPIHILKIDSFDEMIKGI